MNIEELTEEYKNKLDELQKEYKEKVKELEGTKKLEEEKAFIKTGQEYFYIDNYYYEVYKSRNYNCEDDRIRIKIGNYYPFTNKNKEEVLKKVLLIARRKKLQSQIEMFARFNNDKEINWDMQNQVKYFLFISSKDIVIANTLISRNLNTTYFSSHAVAQKALDKFGDRIRELYLDVEEQ